MVSKALHLIIAFFIALITALLIIDEAASFRFRLTWFAQMLALALVAILIWGNLKLNWLRFKPNKLTFKLPKTSQFQIISLLIVPILFYYAAHLSVRHDSHLNNYDIAIQLPLWFFETKWDAHLTIITEDTGVYILFFYVFIASAAGNLYNSGWFSENRAVLKQEQQFSGWMSWSRMIVALVMLFFVLYQNRYLPLHALHLINEGKQEPVMLTLPNTGPLFSRAANMIVMIAYTLWMLIDEITNVR